MELPFPLILDGATGTQLQSRGYDGSVCAEQWVLEHPDVLLEIQRAYVEAGSNVVYAPTFGANSIKLAENHITGKTAEFNQALAELSRRAADGRALVAGDLAPTGKFLEPIGDITFEELYEVYLEQVSALEKAGVDLYVVETMMTVSDARAAVLAVRTVSEKPVLVTFSADANGRSISGSDVAAVACIMEGLGAYAFGLNCSTGPEDMLPVLQRIAGAVSIRLIAKPNAGLPVTVDGRTVYNSTPESFRTAAKQFAAVGVSVLGGCCGSTPDHIAAIAQALREEKPARRAPVGGPFCATERALFRLEDLEAPGEAIACGDDLEDDIMDCEDDVLAIEITSEEDLSAFAECQYAINTPLCICCGDAALLEKALRLYQGRPLYRGSIPADLLEPLQKKYGFLVLNGEEK